MRATINIQQNQGERAKHALHFLRPPPPKLATLLRLIDLVPPDVGLPDLSKKFDRLLESSKGMSEESRMSQAHDLVAECLMSLPKNFQAHVWAGGNTASRVGAKKEIEEIFLHGSPADSPKRLLDEVLKGNDDVWDDLFYGIIYDAVREYSFVRESREKLKRLSRMTPNRGSLSAHIADMMNPIKTSGTISLSKDGRIKISNDRFAKAVEDVEAARLRSCGECKRIFWAGRITQTCCSKPCGNRMRVRRWRETYQTNYKLRRHGHKPLTQEESKRLAARAKPVERQRVKKEG